MRIALFGGSFDPPHVGHQLACQYVLLTHPVDEVWLVPVFRHAFDKRSAPYAHRVALCRIAAAAIGGCSARGEPRVRVCTIEEELFEEERRRGGSGPGPGPSYTLNTVRALKQRHPDDEFQMIIGTDLIKERERWYRWPELATELPFLVIGRDPGRDPGRDGEGSAAPVGPVPPGRDAQHAEPLLLPAISSTEVRERLRAGARPAGWVATAILDYIEQHGLYRAAPAAAPALAAAPPGCGGPARDTDSEPNTH
ncbi:MAG: nicotinate-nicotinamide nucleotide adenylyltransferase [Polyangia bacterium]